MSNLPSRLLEKAICSAPGDHAGSMSRAGVVRYPSWACAGRAHDVDLVVAWKAGFRLGLSRFDAKTIHFPLGDHAGDYVVRRVVGQRDLAGCHPDSSCGSRSRSGRGSRTRSIRSDQGKWREREWRRRAASSALPAQLRRGLPAGTGGPQCFDPSLPPRSLPGSLALLRPSPRPARRRCPPPRSGSCRRARPSPRAPRPWPARCRKSRR